MIEDKIIASDFDGVIADSAAIEEVWRDEYIDKVLPKFEVLELLEDGTIDIILTGRRDVSWVRRWLDKWVKSWHGRIICALSPGDKKLSVPSS